MASVYAKTLRSQSGAFDLPSILVGVVAVGILVAGVLAAIFGVIPFSQDKGAAQDLSAINTAQGVSKAQNGAFTDKAGLTAAGLTGGLPAGMTVTAENGGAGYCATAPSASGKTFAIAAEQTTPWRGDCTFTINTWTKRLPSVTNNGWESVATSSDGRHLLAYQAGISPYLFTSADGGATWTRRDVGMSKAWFRVSVSADGKTMIAGHDGGNLFTSSDSGATWVNQPIDRGQYWYGSALSADGRVMIVGNYSSLWTSRDAGSTWTKQPMSGGSWTSVAIAPDGKTMLAGQHTIGGALYVSTDSGATWGAGLPGYWISTALSADGNTMIAGTYSGSLHTSNDRGITWVSRLTASGRFYQTGISSDGQTMLGAARGGYVYTSANRGVTWKTHTGIGQRSWYNIAVSLSADGKTMAATSNDAFFTTTDGGATWTDQGAALNAGAQWKSAAVSSDGKTIAGGTTVSDLWMGSAGRRVTG